jgi:uncharacterized membrane protein YphA (DoxX/SURF4 family)
LPRSTYPPRSRTLAYWLTTGAAALAFAIPGIGDLARAPHFAEDMARLGYPPFFLLILGTWKVLGAAAILAPGFARLKEWAYAGMIFDLTGAAATRAFVADGAVAVIVPLAIAAVMLSSWALRPPTRRLPEPAEAGT